MTTKKSEPGGDTAYRMSREIQELRQDRKLLLQFILEDNFINGRLVVPQSSSSASFFTIESLDFDQIDATKVIASLVKGIVSLFHAAPLLARRQSWAEAQKKKKKKTKRL